MTRTTRRFLLLAVSGLLLTGCISPANNPETAPAVTDAQLQADVTRMAALQEKYRKANPGEVAKLVAVGLSEPSSVTIEGERFTVTPGVHLYVHRITPGSGKGSAYYCIMADSIKDSKQFVAYTSKSGLLPPGTYCD